MKAIARSAAVVALGYLGFISVGQTQTLNMMKSLDAPHYDGHRTTWSPASDIINMMQDTLVALDWDGRTVLPYLAKSWDVSPDGKTYTFKLRDDVQFCSGKRFTSEDVVYSFKRLKNPETKAPYAWRAGDIKELRALDAHTIAYELTEPYSDLLLQLAMYTNAIHNKDSVEKLGKDYGINGIDGTGPWCFVSWQPRTEILLKRHDAYRWGPSMYQNKGPVKFEKLSIKIIPEDSSRLAAMMGGQFDVTHQMPLQFLQQVRAAPTLQVQEAKPNFQLNYYGFKITRPMVSDKRVREAMSIAINRAGMVSGIMMGNAEPATTFVHPSAPDFAEATEGIVKEDVERAKKLLDEAGWKVGTDGIREKDGSNSHRRSISSRSHTSHALPKRSKATCARSASTGRCRVGIQHLKRSVARVFSVLWLMMYPAAESEPTQLTPHSRITRQQGYRGIENGPVQSSSRS